MKVLFIYPDLNIDVGWQGHYYEGIASLSAILKSRGHSAELCHVYNLSEDRNVIKRLSRGSDLVAFSCTTPMFPYVQYCSRVIKKEFNKNIPILCGGSHPTSAPEETLRDSGVDYACVGEGEYFILDFLEYLEGKRAKSEVKNLAYKDKGGRVIINEIRPPVAPLDSLPFPDRGIFDSQHRNSSIAFVSAGRGCPYQCAYCSNDYLNKIYHHKYLRVRRPETVIREIDALLETYPSIRELAFLDDVFILDREWLLSFCKLYRESCGLPFRALAHPLTITDEKIAVLKESGCSEIGFGIQSGNEFIRNNIMLRRVSNNKIIESIGILKKYKMKFLVDVIFGVPREEKKYMLDTIKFCAENEVEVKSHIFYPLPATRLEQMAVEEGLLHRNVYGEDYHSKTILDYSPLHKARVLFFHRYSKLLTSIYRKIACSLNGIFSKRTRFLILDKTLCSDPFIYSVIMLRSGFINLRSLLRRSKGISEFRLALLKQ